MNITRPDVLLIEGEWRFRAAVRAQLTEMGLKVVGLPTLAAGIELLSISTLARPRVIVVDTVGQEDVGELLPTLQAVAGKVPVVLCTGQYDAALRQMEPEAWAVVLVRPFSIGVLANTVQQLLADQDLTRHH